MLNERTVTVKMKRLELAKLMTACSKVKHEFEYDLETAKTEDEKRIAEGSAKKWANLHDMLQQQLNDFDAKHIGERD